jgi:hypothetical protein
VKREAEFFSDPSERVEGLEFINCVKNAGNDSIELYNYNECVEIRD